MKLWESKLSIYLSLYYGPGEHFIEYDEYKCLKKVIFLDICIYNNVYQLHKNKKYDAFFVTLGQVQLKEMCIWCFYCSHM